MTKERIEEIQTERQRLAEFARDSGVPKVLLLADETLSIRGNEAGLIQLAREILAVAAGGVLSPPALEWLNAEWLPLEEITLDPDPVIAPPPRGWKNQVATYSVLVLVIAPWIIGAVFSVSWVLNRLSR